MKVASFGRRFLFPLALAAIAAIVAPAARAGEDKKPSDVKRAAVEAKRQAAEAEAERKATAEAEAKRKAAEAAAKDKAKDKAAEEAKRRLVEVIGLRGRRRAAVALRIEAAPAPVALQRKIFVPQPKGAGETLDDSAKQGKAAQGDTVTTIRGDRVVGKVLTIDAGGKLRLTAPHFEGEVVVLTSALDRVELILTEKAEGGGDEVALTNGDRIVGEVVRITPESVIVESRATGPLKISRKIVQSISFAQGRTMLLESHFAAGRMAPWTARGGGWSVTGGALVCNSHGSRQTVFAKFDQNEAVTMEVKVEATGGRYVNCELIVFADRTDGSYGHNSIVARFYSSQVYLMYARNGGTNSVTSRSMGSTLRKGVVRVAYDPATSKARVWVDSRDLGEYAIPHKLTTGKFVMFNSRYPCRVSYIRVMRGIVPPSSAEHKADSKTHIIRFANQDRVAAEEVKLADGKLLLKTSFGEIASQVGKVQNIVFRSGGLEKPRRNKGDVYIETSDSRFTAQFEQLTSEYLIATSAYLGQVKVRRASLKRIRFNVYK